MSVPDVAERVRRASSAIGSGQGAGFCERFVRGCFGFPARYPTAQLAWLATRQRHVDMSPPAGVPVFWDILSGPNVGNDHIALSTGGGRCISTSAGPGRTVAEVRIDELTRRWGMRYRGWSEDYHGVVVHTAASSHETTGASTTTSSEHSSSAAGRWPRHDLPLRSRHTPASRRAWRLLMESIGLEDDDVDLAMQRWLRLRGYYSGWLDGDFAAKSVEALQEFLRVKGLYAFPVDGDRGPDTVRAEIRYLNQQRHFL